MTRLPFSQACENNKDAILDVLQAYFAPCKEALEIASGTGQHATHFAGNLPWLHWQPTELPVNLEVLRPRCEHYDGANLREPLALDVTQARWSVEVPEAVFTANSLHIMPASAMEAFFETLASQAPQNCRLAIYGPFNYGGEYTSASNAQFDQWLASQSPFSGIRDFETVESLAGAASFSLSEDVAMPANNRLLLWQRDTATR